MSTLVWQRSVAVARMHFADRLTLLLMPFSILASIFVINVIVWQFVPEDGRSTGGAASIFCFVFAAAALAVTRALSFALGMGASRRSFLIGTLLTGATLAGAWTVALFALQRLEKVTDGWGRQAHFFWFDWFAASSWVGSLLCVLAGLAASFMIGALVGACWARWNRVALLIGVPLLVLIAGGLAILVTAQGWWHHVGHWFADQTPFSTAGWCALVAVVAAALLHPVLRRVRG